MSGLPAFAVLHGPRALLSVIGISTIVSGTWKAENTFDEQGVKAFENANAAGLEPGANFDEVSKINKVDLDSACPIPWLALVGWAILALAHFIPHQTVLGSFHVVVTLPALIGAVSCLTIGFLIALPIREAYNSRDFKSMVQNYQIKAAFATILVGSTIAANVKGPFWLAPIGIFLVALSLHICWKHRKMGESWMRNGRPNWTFIVCNGGGNLYVFGWFLFWLAFTAIPGNVVAAIDVPQVPIYITLRSAMAFVSTFCIVLLTVLVERSTDESEDLQEGLGALGKATGKFSDLFISLSFMLAFGVYGAAAFFPSETTIRVIFDIILVLLMVMQGRAYGLLLQKAIPSKDNDRRSRLGRVIMIVFGFLVIFQAFTGWTSCIFTLIGIVLIASGDNRMMGDRKKGRLWVETGNANPAPYVYSYGPIFYSLGWIFIALAMSIPQFVW